MGAAFSDNSARLYAKVRPNAQETAVSLRVGHGREPRASAPRPFSAGDGWDHVEVNVRIANLKPEKKYRYRVVATNDSGTTVGDERQLHDGRARARARRGRRRRAAGPRPLQAPGRALAAARGPREPSCPWAWPSTRAAGKLRLTTGGRRGATQTGTFGGGVFSVRPAAPAPAAASTSTCVAAASRAAGARAPRAPVDHPCLARRTPRGRRVEPPPRPPPLGQRQRWPLPHPRAPQPRHGARHALAHRGSLQRHAHPRDRGRRRRPRPRAAPQRRRASRAVLPRAEAVRTARRRR